MQIVYISNRNDIAYETLIYVENLMPFITEAVFVCPKSRVNDFKFECGIPVRVMNEEAVLGKDLRRFQGARDHQFRNCLLRFALARLEDLGDEFLMSDDDNRPLAEIPLSFYKSGNRFVGYYFYDLRKWLPRETDYDRGQHETRRILETKGYSTLSYSSHMPQLIHKGLLAEVAGVFREFLDQGAPLDEWSAYFNYGQSVHPERFHAPEPFRTLCWPPFPSDWPFDVPPGEFRFENYYPMLYENGLFFSGLPAGFDGMRHFHVTKEKVRRRMALQSDFDTGNMPFLGRVFILARDFAGRFPNLKRRLNARLPASFKGAILQLILGGKPNKQ